MTYPWTPPVTVCKGGHCAPGWACERHADEAVQAWLDAPGRIVEPTDDEARWVA